MNRTPNEALMAEIMDGLDRLAEKMNEENKPMTNADNLIANGVTFATDNNFGGKWIPVTERLPKPGERVLATDGGFVGEFYINERGQWQRYNVNNYTLLMALDILWWAKMPEPPEVG